MQKIIPHLWYYKEAKEAAHFYASVFPNSKVTNSYVLRGTPSGDCDVMSFDIMGYSFMSISAGPLFKLNPSASFMVNFDPSQMPDASAKIGEVWAKLADGGKVLMELGTYPFSKRYGWLQDKYGVSWQLILTDPAGEERPVIIPSLLFVGDKYGKAEEAGDYYISVFKDAKRGSVAKYGPGRAPDKEDAAMFSDFKIEGQWFAAMDSALQHDFTFSEAVSFIVNCQDQAEIDYYWDKLTAEGGQESMCGWLKDKYGVSWQVAPADLETMMAKATPQQADRVVAAFLPMKKFDLAKLKQAFEGK